MSGGTRPQVGGFTPLTGGRGPHYSQMRGVHTTYRWEGSTPQVGEFTLLTGGRGLQHRWDGLHCSQVGAVHTHRWEGSTLLTGGRGPHYSQVGGVHITHRCEGSTQLKGGRGPH